MTTDSRQQKPRNFIIQDRACATQSHAPPSSSKQFWMRRWRQWVLSHRRLRRLMIPPLLLLVLLLPACYFLLTMLLDGPTASIGSSSSSPSPSSSSLLQALVRWAPSAGARPVGRSEVAIVMVDTRDVLAVPEYASYEEGKVDAFWYGHLTASMNQQYACKVRQAGGCGEE